MSCECGGQVLEDHQRDGRIYFVISVTGLSRPNARKYDDEIIPDKTFM
jgi:hypothetical protein